MRKFIQFFILALSFSFLASCGGGGDLPNSSGSKASLKEAFTKIKKGMSPEQVMAVVGSDPSHTYRHNGQIYALSYWTGSAADNNYASLSINFGSITATTKRVYSKSFVSVDDSDSEVYSY